jgi:hypothetical protein
MVTVVADLCQREWLLAARLVTVVYGLEILTQPVWVASTLPSASVAQ